MIYRPKKRLIREKVLEKTRFAWIPKRMTDGSWVWLSKYKRVKNPYRNYG